MARSHPGFKAVQAGIARREGVSGDRAGAILAAATRRASPAAKAKNPRLKRVKDVAARRKKKGPATTTAYQGRDNYKSY